MPSVDPSLNTKRLIVNYMYELISKQKTQKNYTFLANSVQKLHETSPSNTILNHYKFFLFGFLLT